MLKEEVIELDGNPGRAFSFTLTNLPIADGIGRGRLWSWSSGRLYQVLVLGKKDKVESKATDRYFESFKLVTPK